MMLHKFELERRFSLHLSNIWLDYFLDTSYALVIAVPYFLQNIVLSRFDIFPLQPYQPLSTKFNFFFSVFNSRYSLVFLLRAVIFTMPSVWQICSNQRIKVKPKSFKTEFLQGNHSPVLYISVLSVSLVKISRFENYSLQFVDAVPRCITGNVYPGNYKSNFPSKEMTEKWYLVNSWCFYSAVSFEKDYKKNILQRAWDDLLPNRILIYCMWVLSLFIHFKLRSVVIYSHCGYS